MRCLHRGDHDAINGHPTVPENSADAILGAFNVAPCVEVDLGTNALTELADIEAGRSVALIHDAKAWRTVWEYTTKEGHDYVNGTLGGTQSVEGHDYFEAYSDNFHDDPFTDVTAAYLRSNAPDATTPNRDYPWVLLADLGNYVKRCGDHIGAIELDVRDWNTFVNTWGYLQNLDKTTNSHFWIKTKVWKLASLDHGFAEIEQALKDLNAAGVRTIFSIVQGPNGQGLLESPEGEDDVIPVGSRYTDYDTEITIPGVGTGSAKQVIADLVLAREAGLEVSMPYGGNDPLWKSTQVLLPDPCSADPKLVTWTGWEAYKLRHSACSSTFAPQIGGWIPKPEIENGDFKAQNREYPPNPLQAVDPFWASTGNKILLAQNFGEVRQGFMDSLSGQCCFVPAADSMAERDTDYLPDAEDALIIVSDEDPSIHLSSKYVVSQSFFLVP
jgi:hypothetical protein